MSELHSGDRVLHLRRDEAEYLALLIARQESSHSVHVRDALDATDEIRRLEMQIDTRRLAERLIDVLYNGRPVAHS
jgi:hypothetical protein